MVRARRQIMAALLMAAMAASVCACKSPPPHSDSTRGTTNQDRDTGMHDNHM